MILRLYIRKDTKSDLTHNPSEIVEVKTFMKLKMYKMTAYDNKNKKILIQLIQDYDRQTYT